jgi:hypothetical protein
MKPTSTCPRTWFALALFAAGVVLSCAGKSDESRAGKDELAAKVQDLRAVADDSAVRSMDRVLNDNRPPLTSEEYETLLLGLASCEVKSTAIDPRCPARKAFQDARTRANTVKDLSGLTAELGKKHIHHPSPAVRMQAATFLGSIFGADASSQSTILEAVRAEPEPAVIAAMLDAVGSRGAERPEVGELLLDMADHASPEVRKKALLWLGSSWSQGLPGSIERLIRAIETDPDMNVRAFACKFSGRRGDDQLVPIYDRHTRNPRKQPVLYSACMQGLLESWMNYPLYQTHNEKAYQLTLARLAHTPRSKDNPPWALLGRFADLSRETRGLIEWRQKATWFQRKDVLAVLQPIVVDGDANPLARAGALESMIALGASQEQLETMRQAIKDSDPAGKQLIESLDRAIASR